MKSIAVAGLAALALLLGGCSGIVGGELADVDQYAVDVPHCDTEKGPTAYYFEVDPGATNDYLDDNWAGELSGWTLGLIPTYWLSSVTSHATLYHNGERLADYHYDARIHKFYGLLWGLLLIPVNALVDDYNEVPANEGVGLAVAWIMRDKTAARTYLDATGPGGIDPGEICFRIPPRD